MAYLIKDNDGNAIIREGKEVIGMDLTGTVKGVDEKKRIITITGSDQSTDRDGDIITVKGWKMENYVKNPVFLWAHQYSVPPIGVATKVVKRKAPMRLDFNIRFMEEGINPFADMIYRMFVEKFMNASSVGFIPLKWEPIKQDEPKENERSFWSPRKYIEQELLELSAVPVPANPNALQNALKGMSLPDCTKTSMLETFNGRKPFEVDEGKYNLLWEMASDMAKGISYEEEKDIQVQVPEDEEFKTIAFEEEFDPVLYDEKGELLDGVTMLEDLPPFKGYHVYDFKPEKEFDSYALVESSYGEDEKPVSYIYGLKGKDKEKTYIVFSQKTWNENDVKFYIEEKYKDSNGEFLPAEEEKEGFEFVEESVDDSIKGELLESKPDERIDTVLLELKNIKEEVLNLKESLKVFIDSVEDKQVLDDDTSLEEPAKDVFEEILGEDLEEDIGKRIEQTDEDFEGLQPSEELIKQLTLLKSNLDRKISKTLSLMRRSK